MTLPTTRTPKPPPVENYQSLMDRMEIFHPHTDCVRFGLCYKHVKYEFRSHKRRSEYNPDGTQVRYLEHIRRALLIALGEIGVTDLITHFVILFHDSREDTRTVLEEITILAGAEVSKRVALCSKCPKQGFMTRLWLHGDWRVLLTKAVDRIDNLRTMGTDAAFRAKTIEETEREYIPLMQEMVTRTEPGTTERTWCSRARDILLETLLEEKARA